MATITPLQPQQQDCKSKTQSNFNPLNHIPPKYDIFGYLKPPHKCRDQYNVLSERDNIKIPWNEKATNKTGVSTRTELLARRHLERIPDISYDLDKDGYVGGRDFVIAKRFDVDNDGKLNEQEKKAAYEGIANNIEDNYIWNIDNQGGTRPFRLLQKRGKIIDAEDFLPIQDTYPRHPISEIKPHVTTYGQLKEKRKKATIEDINKNIADWDKRNPPVDMSNYVSSYATNKPLHSSQSEIKLENHRAARIKCGLEPDEKDIKDSSKDPTLQYVYNPKHKTKGDIENEFQKENLEESKKLMQMKHKDEVTRLNEREDEIFAKLYSEEDRKTYTKLQNQRRKETNEYNIKTFSNQTLGVHGHELPKFSESKTMKEFWKGKEGYCENPKHQSYVEYTDSIKYWKPPEELYLNEHRDEPPQSVDPFKKEHVLAPLEKKDNIILKVNKINIFKNFDPNKTAPVDIEGNKIKHIYRWTTLVNQFAPNKFKKGRFFDNLPKDKNHPTDENKQVFSSFAPGAVFSSDYMNKNVFNNAQNAVNKAKAEMEKVSSNEMMKTAKDSLFQKFSSKDPTKNVIPKSTALRTKPFN